MFKIRIIAVSRGNVDWVEQACDHYEKLLKKYASVETVRISSRKASRNLSPTDIRKSEMELIIKSLSDWFSIALTDSGDKLDSIAFANKLETWRDKHGGRIQFLIGGAFGLDPALLLNSGFRLSLSPLTFSHQLVRPILMEQLFRGLSILHGSDYHK